MQVTVEISMYPLDAAYVDFILAFINDLKSKSGLEVRVNETSTHLFGEYDVVFDALKSAIKASYLRFEKNVFVIKVLGGNLKGTAAGL
jgi:uncharacterized protein YqgV (UPF0045/DUF77 family)